MNPRDSFISPLQTRYASKEISFIFSDQFKFSTWRKLWLTLAKAQKKLGLAISDIQIKEMEKALENIDFERAAFHEKRLRHDVMAHVHTFAESAPSAKGIIHLGATSAFVTDNTELIQMKEALLLIQNKLISMIRLLSDFCEKYAALPCLGYTHLQPAQPTTVGKRAAMWLQDFVLDFKEISYRLENLHFLGVKGATGTAASFLSLFDGDEAKVKKLDQLIAEDLDFSKIFMISGQTYTRKQDISILNTLASFASSSHKCATDLRLLAHFKEIEEGFEENQVGSSAMPHKRNPIRSERICGLARFVLSLSENPLYTHATQWLERSLDDSANRRLAIPESFLAIDAICNLWISIFSGLAVYPQVIERRLQEELPFLATENLLMAAVKKGEDRQKMHELIRKKALNASQKIKEEGESNDLLKKLGSDSQFPLSEEELKKELDIHRFIGRAENQVKDYLSFEVKPLLQKYASLKSYLSSIEV